MIRPLSARRLLIGISVIMLLLCQTAAVALAYVAAPAATPLQAAALEANAEAPCQHGTQIKDDGTPPAHGCQDRCPSRNASLQTAKTDIPAADTFIILPVSTVRAPHAGIRNSTPHQQIVASATPPPLILVYCRLLI